MAHGRRRRDRGYSTMVGAMMPDPEPYSEQRYTHKTEPLDSRRNEPTTRSPQRSGEPGTFGRGINRQPHLGNGVRSHEQLAADKLGDLPLSEGLNLRMRMTHQEDNDQFPYLAPDGKVQDRDY